MSAWTNVNVNGALADSLVTDFGGALGATNVTLPPDSELCLTLDYSSSAASQVRIYLATGVGAAAQNLVMIYDSAFQTNPGADSTQYLTGICVSVPLIPGTQVPMQLRITKANTTAIIRFKTIPKMGPCC